METEKLPSFLQLGDYCDLVLGIAPDLKLEYHNLLRAGKVINIHFSNKKVRYDLEFTISIDSAGRHTTRIHNVDSAFCVKRTQEWIDERFEEYKGLVN